MAKTIQVRGVPDAVHTELRRRAAEANTSLSDYALHELVRATRRPANAEVLLQAASRSWSIDNITSAELVRDARLERA